jgi:DNA polymerase-3 subunit delta
MDTVTLIYLPQVDNRGQKSSWFTALDEAGITIEAKQVQRGALPAWLGARLKSQDQSADSETLHFIADKVEGNLLAAYQEIQKLALLLPPGRLSFEQVKEAVLDVARFDMFSLGEAMIAGDARHVVRIVEGLKGEGAAPPLILWVITEEIRALGRVIAAVSAGSPMPQALREARVWGSARQNLFQSRVRAVSQAQVETAIMHAARLDRVTKGLIKGDLWDELTQLALCFTRDARPILGETR